MGHDVIRDEPVRDVLGLDHRAELCLDQQRERQLEHGECVDEPAGVPADQRQQHVGAAIQRVGQRVLSGPERSDDERDGGGVHEQYVGVEQCVYRDEHVGRGDADFCRCGAAVGSAGGRDVYYQQRGQPRHGHGLPRSGSGDGGAGQQRDREWGVDQAGELESHVAGVEQFCRAGLGEQSGRHVDAGQRLRAGDECGDGEQRHGGGGAGWRDAVYCGQRLEQPGGGGDREQFALDEQRRVYCGQWRGGEQQCDGGQRGGSVCERVCGGHEWRVGQQPDGD